MGTLSTPPLRYPGEGSCDDVNWISAKSTFGWERIERLHSQLDEHRVYTMIRNYEDLSIFMENHVVAVWDFMTLLKSLQMRLTSVRVPWVPSRYDKRLVRIMNEIVLGEESDFDYRGRPRDHFTTYCDAMVEVGANPCAILHFMTTLDDNSLTATQAQFVHHHLDLARTGTDSEVAGAFFFGREKLIPSMFQKFLAKMRAQLQAASGPEAAERLRRELPNFIHYFERHIAIDQEEHGPLAQTAMELICGGDENLWEEAMRAGERSLERRVKLWDAAAGAIERSSTSEAKVSEN